MAQRHCEVKSPLVSTVRFGKHSTETEISGVNYPSSSVYSAQFQYHPLTPSAKTATMVELIKAKLTVRKNKSYDSSLQINASVGTKGFVVYEETVVEENESRNSSTQLNYPMSGEVVREVVGAKVEMKEDTDEKQHKKKAGN